MVSCGKDNSNTSTSTSTSSSTSETNSDSSSTTPSTSKEEPETVYNYDYNPLTGLPYKDGEVTTSLPVAVMVSNSKAAYPQRGVSEADVVYEMVTEGGITRLMALYSSANAMPGSGVGPIRSIRDQFVQLLMPYNAIPVHIGTSIYAENLFAKYQYSNVDGKYLGTTAFAFDSIRGETYLNEHCWFTAGDFVQAGMDKVGISADGTFEQLFNFSNKTVNPSEGEANNIDFSYSDTYDVGFSYNADSKTYFKTAFDVPHMDEKSATQLNFTNVIVLFTNITLKEDGNCTDFDMLGGAGYYISNGAYEEITWSKGLPEEMLRLYNADGDELKVNTGKSYVSFLGTDRFETLYIA